MDSTKVWNGYTISWSSFCTSVSSHALDLIYSHICFQIVTFYDKLSYFSILRLLFIGYHVSKPGEPSSQVWTRLSWSSLSADCNSKKVPSLFAHLSQACIGHVPGIHWCHDKHCAVYIECGKGRIRRLVLRNGQVGLCPHLSSLRPLQVVQKGDVLLEFDGIPIANDGTVHLR